MRRGWCEMITQTSHVAPLGLGACRTVFHGLRPVATACRPVGTQRQLHEQFAESSRLEAAIRSNLEGLGYGG